MQEDSKPVAWQTRIVRLLIPTFIVVSIFILFVVPQVQYYTVTLPRYQQKRAFLAHLSLEHIARFEVDGQSIPVDERLRQVVRALGDVQSFTWERGCCIGERLLVITTRDNRQYRFHLSSHIAHGGAVIEFIYGDEDNAQEYAQKGYSSEGSDGEVLSYDLPAALLRLGITIAP
jgi:hypothetical protein